MAIDHRKELTPVLYDESAVKILKPFDLVAGHPCFSPHWHERMELLLVQRGSLHLVVGKQQVTVAAGELGLIPPSAVHKAIAGEKGVLYRVLMFDVAAFLNGVRGSKRLLGAFLGGELAVSPCIKDPAAIAAVQQIVQAHGDKSATPLFISAQVYLLFDRLLAGAAPVKEVPIATDERFLDVLRYVDMHFTEPLSVKALSARFGYAESYFCRRFKTVSGLSPVKYINLQRLETAKRLMEEGKTGVTDIAAVCGFSDSDYFARCFKSTYGYTPTHYIALQKENV